MALSIDQLNYVLDQFPSLTTGQALVIGTLSNTPIGGVIVCTTNQPGPIKCHQSALRALETAGWIRLTKTEGGYLTLPSKSLMAIITLAKVIHPREPILA